jgi:hypothetical protein
MDGGTCESSAYCQRGYDATGICIALGNYHNMNVRRKRIGPEYVDLRLWGIPGAFIAVPLLAAARVVCQHVDSLRPFGELLGTRREAAAPERAAAGAVAETA